jgi:hypothetical protein
MNWGYKKGFKANAIILSNSFEHEYRPISTGHSGFVVRQRQSPPLGFPIATAPRELQILYRGYIKEIVQCDLESYAPVAYTDQDSTVPQRLLGAVCLFYDALSMDGREVFNCRTPIIYNITNRYLV